MKKLRELARGISEEEYSRHSDGVAGARASDESCRAFGFSSKMGNHWRALHQVWFMF